MAGEISPLTMQGLYKYVVANLDKTNAPSFTIEHFNHYANGAQMDWCHERYRLFEETQQLTDDLRSLVTTFLFTVGNTPNLSSTQVCPLPANYFHTLRVAAQFTPLRTFGEFKVNKPIRRTVQRLTADSQGFSERPNYYHRPSYNNPGFRVTGNEVTIKTNQPHSGIALTSVEYEYLRLPTALNLYESDLDDMTVDNSQILPWPAYVTLELGKGVTQRIMEQHMNQRQGSFAQVNTVIPNQPTAGGGAGAPAQERAAVRANQLGQG